MQAEDRQNKLKHSVSEEEWHFLLNIDFIELSIFFLSKLYVVLFAHSTQHSVPSLQIPKRYSRNQKSLPELFFMSACQY